MTKSSDVLNLDNQLCFPMYAASRKIINKYTPLLEEIGLTYTQYITMLVLWEKKELTAKELGRKLYLDSGTLTPLLKKMEAKGLLTRKRSTMDERNLIVRITEEGERLRERAGAIPEKMAGYSVLSDEESEDLYRILYKIVGED